jgi:hypothetical protein
MSKINSAATGGPRKNIKKVGSANIRELESSQIETGRQEYVYRLRWKRSPRKLIFAA